MTITPKIRYRYMVKCWRLYFQWENENETRLTANKSDAKKFDSIAEAGEVRDKLIGSRIVRYDMLTGNTEDILELMKDHVERRWIKGENRESEAEDAGTVPDVSDRADEDGQQGRTGA